LVIGGEDDKVTLASHSEAIAAAIPGAKLLLLPGVHLLNVERPAEFMEAVLGFLSAAPNNAATAPSPHTSTSQAIG
jgi:3-oxoadipate enol-lactonase